MLRHSSRKIIYEHNDEHHARHVVEHEKPKQKVTATEVAPTSRISRSSPHRAQRKAKKESMKVASIGGDQMRSLMLALLPLASCGVDKRMYGTRTLRPAETALTRT
jgi:hypothetical protein